MGSIWEGREHLREVKRLQIPNWRSSALEPKSGSADHFVTNPDQIWGSPDPMSCHPAVHPPTTPPPACIPLSGKIDHIS